MQGDSAEPVAKPQWDYSVVINCNDNNVEVSAAQNGNAVSFSCFDVNGQQVAVNGLTNLLPGHGTTLQGYDAIIDFNAVGDSITFDLDCSASSASAIVWKTLERAQNQGNSGIEGEVGWGAGCASNSNTSSGSTNEHFLVHN